MAKEIKLKKSFGSVTIDRFSPKVPEGMPKEKKPTQRRNDAKTQRGHFKLIPLRPCALASLRSFLPHDSMQKLKKTTQRRNDAKTQRIQNLYLPLRPCDLAPLRSCSRGRR